MKGCDVFVSFLCKMNHPTILNLNVIVGKVSFKGCRLQKNNSFEG